MSSTPSHLSGEPRTEHFLELVIDTVQRLTLEARGPFLQRFFNGMAGVEVSESESVAHWEGILRRRSEMSGHAGQPVSFMAAAADYFATAHFFRSPILLEYEELQRLRHAATTDALTGLYNRRLFEEYLSKELNRSRRYAIPLTLLLFDLRNFKRVNDTYGHSIGDEILGSLARACQESVRGADYSFRIGGDEFAVLLPQAETPSAENLAQRICQKFEQYTHRRAPDVGLGLDFGLASYPKDGETRERLFEVADRNVYAHKEEQRRTSSEPPPANPGPAALPPPADPQPLVVEPRSQKRRYERIRVLETGARGILHNGFEDQEVRLLDVGFGGISFLLNDTAQLPEVFFGRVHVPPFRETVLKFRRVYAHMVPEGRLRVGCSFTA